MFRCHQCHGVAVTNNHHLTFILSGFFPHASFSLGRTVLCRRGLHPWRILVLALVTGIVETLHDFGGAQSLDEGGIFRLPMGHEHHTDELFVTEIGPELRVLQDTISNDGCSSHHVDVGVLVDLKGTTGALTSEDLREKVGVVRVRKSIGGYYI